MHRTEKRDQRRTVPVSLTLWRDQVAAVDALSKRLDRTRSHVVRVALDELLARASAPASVNSATPEVSS